MRKQSWIMTAGAIVTLASACATTTSRNLDQKLATEPEVENRDALSSRATDLIENAPDLTEAQKKDLMAIKKRLRADLDSYASQSLRLRSVLMKDMLTASYDAEEVSLIESRMKDVENKRLSAIFNAVDRANKILGRKSIRVEVMKNILSEGRSGGG